MLKRDQKKLAEAIYFLKLSELKQFLAERELATSGKKQELIDRILEYCGLPPAQTNQKSKLDFIPKKRGEKDSYTSETHIIPGQYTNGQLSRQKFKELIGQHFKFTTYGMTWIKECWAKGITPSYEDFAKYWQSEYDRRKSGGDFQSAQTNRRVVFFRDHKGLSKEALEKAWQSERKRMYETVRELLESV